MTQIEKGELELDAFVSEVAAMVEEIVKAPLIVPEISGLPRRKKCLTKDCGGYLRHISKEKTSFFACSVCGCTFRERDGEPVENLQTAEKIEAACPLRCGRKARRLEGSYGFFWICGCSPDSTFRDVDGRPTIREERPKAKCPVKGCKGTAEQYRTKSGERLFWKCGTCRNTLNDDDGKPVIGQKKAEKKSDVKNVDYSTA